MKLVIVVSQTREHDSELPEGVQPWNTILIEDFDIMYEF